MSIRLIEAPGAPAFDEHVGLVGAAGLRPSSLAVVDASYIFDRAAERVRRTDPPLGVAIGGLGSVRMFAPSRIANELRWNVHAAAQRLHVPPVALSSTIWREFVTRIRFVDLPPASDLHDRRLRSLSSMDPDDIDLGRLGLLLAPSHVFSHDKHLRIAGFSLSMEELDAVVAAGVAVEISDGALVTTGFAVRAGAAGVSGAVKGIAVRLEVPLWVVALVGALLVAGGAWWALSSPGRKAKAEELLRTLAVGASEMVQRRVEGKKLLEQTSLRAPSASLEDRIFRALAFSRGPMLASEIQSALVVGGDAPTAGWIRDYMRSHPAFVPVGPNHWQLGRLLAVSAS